MPDQIHDASKNGRGDGLNWTVRAPGVNRSLILPMLTIFQQQCDRLYDHHKSLNSWAQRHQQLMDEGLRVWRAYLVDQDAAAGAKAYGDWLRNAAQLLAEGLAIGGQEFQRLYGVGRVSAIPLGLAGDAPPSAPVAAGKRKAANRAA